MPPKPQPERRFLLSAPPFQKNSVIQNGTHDSPRPPGGRPESGQKPSSLSELDSREPSCESAHWNTRRNGSPKIPLPGSPVFSNRSPSPGHRRESVGVPPSGPDW